MRILVLYIRSISATSRIVVHTCTTVIEDNSSLFCDVPRLQSVPCPVRTLPKRLGAGHCIQAKNRNPDLHGNLNSKRGNGDRDGVRQRPQSYTALRQTM